MKKLRVSVNTMLREKTSVACFEEALLSGRYKKLGNRYDTNSNLNFKINIFGCHFVGAAYDV
jgi:hypothetical protein